MTGRAATARDDDGCGHGGVCASAQSNAAPCETAKAPKKPCFLKVWIHDLKNGNSARTATAVGTAASPPALKLQRSAKPRPRRPKKPCFLKVWIHDWKNGHGSGCGSCQNGGGSCCQSGKCCGGADRL